MDFDKAFERVIGHEGGYVNDTRDPGGETKYGISKRAYPFADIKNLTLDQAKDIYRRDYWNKLHLDELPACVRFDIFDAAVNSGTGAAAKFLQRAAGTTADGVIGKLTIAAANGLDPQLLDKRLSGYRLQFLADLPVFPTFGRGWLRRVASNLIED